MIYRSNSRVCLTKNDMFSADKASYYATVRNREVAGVSKRSAMPSGGFLTHTYLFFSKNIDIRPVNETNDFFN